MTLVLLIILLIIILLLLLLYYNHTKNYFTNNINTNINIGNTLADYFFNLGKAIINTTEFKNTKNGDFNDIIFFKDLPNEIKMNTYTEWSQVYNNFKMNYNNLDEIRNTINIEHGSSMWECIDKTRESFWISMKPIINRILNDTFKKSNLMKDINYPIIHFRCADTPFVKHKAYHLQKYSFFKDALNEIKNTTNIFDNQKKILILYNNTHYSNEENKTACNIYADELKNYIKTLGYEPFIDTYSDIDDFALLFYAPAVISTHSSFSFMSGFFGNGKFISAGHFYENDNNIQICNDCGPWLYKGYDLYHKNVNDYHDTKTVINKLNELLDKFSNTPQITLSSCFYIIKNKHNINNYIKWMKNLFSIVNNFNLVIYTDNESYNKFKNYINKDNKNIKIVIKNMEDFYLYKYKDKWIKNHNNSNISLHNIIDWKVNLLWHEKIFLVKDTIDNKYFNTPLYGWCDIGYFRNDYSDMINFNNWPSNYKLLDEMIKSNKMHIGNVQNSTDNYNSYKNEIINHYKLKQLTQPLSDIEQISISAGFFILTSKIINQISKLFENKINYYFDNNYYIKHDQNIYLDIIVMNPELFQLYYENNPQYDNWFMFQRILS